jgi:hypothetical protein
VWYGKRVKGVEDVDKFREWYSLVTTMLREKAA